MLFSCFLMLLINFVFFSISISHSQIDSVIILLHSLLSFPCLLRNHFAVSICLRGHCCYILQWHLEVWIKIILYFLNLFKIAFPSFSKVHYFFQNDQIPNSITLGSSALTYLTEFHLCSCNYYFQNCML